MIHLDCVSLLHFVLDSVGSERKQSNCVLTQKFQSLYQHSFYVLPCEGNDGDRLKQVWLKTRPTGTWGVGGGMNRNNLGLMIHTFIPWCDSGERKWIVICSHTYRRNQSLHSIGDSPYSQNSWAAGARLATSPPYQEVNDCNVRVAWRHDSEHRLQNLSWGAAFRTQQRALPSYSTKYSVLVKRIFPYNFLVLESINAAINFVSKLVSWSRWRWRHCYAISCSSLTIGYPRLRHASLYRLRTAASDLACLFLCVSWGFQWNSVLEFSVWQSDKKCDNVLIKKCDLVCIVTFVCCCWIRVSNKISWVRSCVVLVSMTLVLRWTVLGTCQMSADGSRNLLFAWKYWNLLLFLICLWTLFYKTNHHCRDWKFISITRKVSKTLLAVVFVLAFKIFIVSDYMLVICKILVETSVNVKAFR